ncbi:MAG: ParB/RepB/Spo0J family partition protein [Methylomonas sp.]
MTKDKSTTSSRKPARKSPLDKLSAMSKDNLDVHRSILPKFSDLLKGDDEHQSIALDLIDPNPWQPRKVFDQSKILSLAASIEELGLIEPIIVRRREDRFEIIAGERRWRAFQFIQRTHIDVVIKMADDLTMALMALAENMDREDLSDYEVALQIDRVKSAFKNKAELARHLDKSRSELYRYLAFLDLPAWVKEVLDEKPHLFYRSTAEELKKFFMAEVNASSIFHDATLKAFERLEAGMVTQNRLIHEIKRIAAAGAHHDNGESSIILNSAGKAVGKLKNNGKNITMTLSCAELDDEKQKALVDFVNELLSKAVAQEQS